MKAAAEVSGGRRILRFIVAAATEDWGTKFMALVLALIVFIGTRDEVTREFTIPLRVIEDPDRVLLTRPPETVDVQLRGPWANLNRIAATELGSAALDLRHVRPGPMTLDPAAIVMPRGVILDRLDYDSVDLRFEAVVERSFGIEPRLEGTVDDDYFLASTRVEPESAVVRGQASLLDDLDHLKTGPVDIAGVSSASERVVSLEQRDPRLTVLGLGEDPQVRVSIELIPVIGEIALEVPTGGALREAIPELEAEIPEVEGVSVRGPRALLRRLEGLERPLEVHVETESASAGSVTLRFAWSPILDAEVASQLSIEPPLIRLRVARGASTTEPSPSSGD